MTKGFGALIVVVNQVGSLFYGGMLGVFILAFFVKRVSGTAAFIGVLAGEAAIFAAARFTNIAFLWYNVIGCVVVIAVALVVPGKARARRDVAGPGLTLHVVLSNEVGATLCQMDLKRSRGLTI